MITAVEVFVFPRTVIEGSLTVLPIFATVPEAKRGSFSIEESVSTMIVPYNGVNKSTAVPGLIASISSFEGFAFEVLAAGFFKFTPVLDAGMNEISQPILLPIAILVRASAIPPAQTGYIVAIFPALFNSTRAFAFFVNASKSGASSSEYGV